MVAALSYYSDRTLTSVILDLSATSINSSAYYGCSNITSLQLNEGLLYIREYAFYDCSGLTSITIPSTVLTIGDCAFAACWSLKEVKLLNPNTIIARSAFAGCDDAHVCYPDGRSISGKHAGNGVVMQSSYNILFDYIPTTTSPPIWYGLRNQILVKNRYELIIPSIVAIPEGCQIIDRPSQMLGVIDTFYIPDTVTLIYNNAYLMSSLKSIELSPSSNLEIIRTMAFSRCTYLSTPLTIPAETIDEYAFFMCSSLPSVVFTNTCTLGKAAFMGCTSLTDVTFKAGYTMSPTVQGRSTTSNITYQRIVPGYPDSYIQQIANGYYTLFAGTPYFMKLIAENNTVNTLTYKNNKLSWVSPQYCSPITRYIVSKNDQELAILDSTQTVTIYSLTPLDYFEECTYSVQILVDGVFLGAKSTISATGPTPTWWTKFLYYIDNLKIKLATAYAPQLLDTTYPIIYHLSNQTTTTGPIVYWTNIWRGYVDQGERTAMNYVILLYAYSEMLVNDSTETQLIGKIQLARWLLPIIMDQNPAPPQNITIIYGNNQVLVRWNQYTGTVNAIDAYRLYVNGEYYSSAPGDTNRLIIPEYLYDTFSIQLSSVNMLNGEGPLSTAYLVTKPDINNFQMKDAVSRTLSVSQSVYGLEDAFIISSDTGGLVRGTGNVSLEIVQITIPGVPIDVTASITGQHQVTISWTSPNDPYSSIINYFITVNNSDTGSSSVIDTQSTNVTYILNNLPVGKYTFAVRAVNGVGTSNLSSQSNEVTIMDAPSAPLDPILTQNITTLSLSWTSPLHNGSGPILFYIVEVVNVITGETTQSNEIYTTSHTIYNMPDSYKFRVSAANVAGNGDWSIYSNKVGKDILPHGLLLSGMQESTSRTIKLSWISNDIPSFTATNYIIYLNNTPINTNSTDLSYNITNIVFGIPYIIQVAGQNEYGIGPRSNTVTIVPISYPGIPENINAVPSLLNGDGIVNITWNPPTDTGGTPIIDYQIDISNGASIVHIPGLSYQISSLIVGVPIYFAMRAFNMVGSSARTQWLGPIVPGAVPGPPINVQLSQDIESITIQWDAPQDDTCPINYKLYIEHPYGFEYNVIIETGSVNTTYRWAPSLIIRPALYKVRVVAQNLVGYSPYSDRAFINTRSYPGTPTFVTAALTSHTLDVEVRETRYFDPPVVAYAIDILNGITYTHPGSGSGVLRIYDIFPAGKRITLAIRAINSQGDSSPRTPWRSVYYVETPLQPLALQASLVNGAIVLTWFKPPDISGGIFGEYTIETNIYDDNGENTYYTENTTYTLQNLSYGNQYIINVYATVSYPELSEFRRSAPSTVSITPYDLPDPPEIRQAIVGDGTLLLRWSNPYLGGVYSWDFDILIVNGATISNLQGNEYTISGLPNGVPVYVRMRTRTYGVTTNLSELSAVYGPYTPGTTPGIPRNLALIHGDLSLTVTWDPPIDNGISIDGYKVYAQDGDDRLVVVNTTDNSTFSSAINTWMPAFHPRIIAVSAFNNNNGEGPSASITGIIYAMPPVLTGLVGGAGIGTVTAMTEDMGYYEVPWNVNPSDFRKSYMFSYGLSDAPIDTYIRIEYDFPAATHNYPTIKRNGNTNVPYTFYVSMKISINGFPPALFTNAIGPAATIDVIPFSNPDPIVNLTQHVLDSTHIKLSWDPPYYTGGGTILSYAIDISANGAHSSDTVTETTYTYTIPPGSTLPTIGVATVNTNQPPPYNDTLLSTYTYIALSLTPSTIVLPNPPTGVTTVVDSSSSIFVSWTPPASMGSGTFQRYDIRCQYGSTTLTNTSTTLHYTQTNLTYNTPYTFTVRTVTTDGVSAWSASSTLSIPTTPPAPPQNIVIVQDTSSSAHLTWTTPTMGSGTFLRYDIRNQYTENGQAAETIRTSNTTMYTQTNLAFDISYNFTLRTVTTTDTSVWSTPYQLRLTSIPLPPRNVRVRKIANSTVLVLWELPESLGSGAFRYYEIQYHPTNNPLPQSVLLTHTQPALSLGVAYTFKVRTVTTAGTSDWSNLAPITLTDVPEPPLDVSANADPSGNIVLTWAPPTSIGSGQFSHYDVSYSYIDASGSYSTSSLQYILYSPMRDILYTFTVRTVTDIATSAWTDPISFTVLSIPPGPPRALTAAPQSASSVSVAWAPPTTFGTGTFQHYIVKYEYVVNGVTNSNTFITTMSPYIQTSLLTAIQYTFTISTVTTVGQSAWSTPVSITLPDIPPGPPIGLTVVQTGRARVDLTWNPPASFGTSAFSYYEVRRSTLAASPVLLRSQTTDISDNNLSQSILYTYDVRTICATAQSEWSTVITKILTNTPLAPTNVRGVRTTTLPVNGVYDILISWRPPTDTGGLDLSTNVIRIYKENIFVTAFIVAGDLMYYSYSAVSTGTYTFSVTAVNEKGAGPPSARSPALLVSDGNGGGNTGGTICFVGKTPILTPSGYRPIETLHAGDLIITADNRTVPISRLVHQRVRASASTNPYRIKRGQFGATQDILISPDHRIAVAGVGLVEAKYLGLQQVDRTGSINYYNIELPDYNRDRLRVAGIEAESLASITRIEMDIATFLQKVRAKYGPTISRDLLNSIKRECVFLPNGNVLVPAQQIHR